MKYSCDTSALQYIGSANDLIRYSNCDVVWYITILVMQYEIQLWQ